MWENLSISFMNKESARTWTGRLGFHWLSILKGQFFIVIRSILSHTICIERLSSDSVLPNYKWKLHCSSDKAPSEIKLPDREEWAILTLSKHNCSHVLLQAIVYFKVKSDVRKSSMLFLFYAYRNAHTT